MVDERFRIMKIVSVMAVIFKDGGQIVNFRTKMLGTSLKTIMLAMQELKRIVKRTIID